LFGTSSQEGLRVSGLGDVGLAVVQAAKLVGAERIFAIDVNPLVLKVCIE
jgi:Zn-dependent alcohol dehydrogenase